VLRDLATGTDFVLGNVAEYDFDKKGKWLVTLIDAGRPAASPSGAESPNQQGQQQDESAPEHDCED